MSERKVLTKYIPPDFDPSKITRTPRHLRPTGPKLIKVRLMAPFSMKCTACGEFIYKGRKFNAQKETTDEKYLAITIFRFYIRCTRCSGEITFKTDPARMDYTCERGAKRNFEPWRKGKEVEETDEERLDRLEREEAEEQEIQQRNAMAELEQKTMDSKKEMQIADALDEIRTRNARIERGERGGKEESALAAANLLAEQERIKMEREDDEAVRRAFAAQNATEEQQASTTAAAVSEGGTTYPSRPAEYSTIAPSFARVKKTTKPLIPGLVRKSEGSKASLTLGLGDYDSD